MQLSEWIGWLKSCLKTFVAAKKKNNDNEDMCAVVVVVVSFCDG